ncbi:DUF3262 family protein [Azoarcus olearius]|uniref:Conserved hypothetical membrane protein n=1 Tax=Azoarcus sp. (strain BH72) TaxID=418699 RepID=A1K754_AZOSB|nr:DUF3262 family protein [Azoarcus olearius]CAL94659.1 conserved hypothetical membrane protein [Azoarcus olearius]
MKIIALTAQAQLIHAEQLPPPCAEQLPPSRGSLRGNDHQHWAGTFTGKYGVTSLADFLASPDAQIQAATAYHSQVWATLSGNYGAESYIGTTIGGIEITQSGLVAAAHLLGAGTVGKWLASSGATNPTDGNGTTLTAYLSEFAGYALSATAPTYASLLASEPEGGAGGTGYVYTKPPLSPTSGTGSAAILPGRKSHSFASAAEGFRSATGYHMGQVRTLFIGVVAMTVLTWMAYVVFTKWHGYSHGVDSIRDMTFDILRATVVSLVIMLLMV